MLLWAPLLLFSSGAPTYSTPSLLSFHVNATLSASRVPAPPPPGPSSAGGHARQLRSTLGEAQGSYAPLPPSSEWAEFELFRGGARRRAQQWPGASTLPPEGFDGYAPEQFQQLQVAPVSSHRG